MNQVDQKEANRVSIQSMILNFLLFIYKLIFGFLIKSSSLISDAIHSFSDILSTIVVLIGIKMSCKPSDQCHPYGHEKIETVIAFLLGIMLFGIGGGIGYDGFQKLVSPKNSIEHPLWINMGALSASIISIVGKEWMYRFTMKTARRINSASMKADAWHHRSDSLSSIGSLIGVIGILIGLPLMDSIACLIIMVFIFKAAYDIVAEASRRMVDRNCSEETNEHIRMIVLNNDQVLNIDALKTRMFGSQIYVDLEITLDKDLSLENSHRIASEIHDEVEEALREVKHCMIHMNPSGLDNHHHI